MEDTVVHSGKEMQEKPQDVENGATAEHAENVKKVTKSVNPGVAGASKVSGPTNSRKIDTKSSSVLNSGFARSTISSSLRTSNSVLETRRNSTGGLPEKLSVSTTRQQNTTSTVAGKKATTSFASEPVRRSLPELRRSSLPSVATKPTSRSTLSETRKSVPVSPVGRSLSTSTASDSSVLKTARKSTIKPALSVSPSLKKVASSSVDSTGSTASIKTASKISSPSARSPTVSSSLRARSLSLSLDRSSNLSGRRRLATPESRDSRFVVLPQVEIKAGDNVRLDLRGHRVRSLKDSGLNLSPNLEFVYLRDNLLSTLEGVHILMRVKVLDLSFNEFKGPGFEPLENCKALQQLYLAGNQITSLASLPQLPNLEFPCCCCCCCRTICCCCYRTICCCHHRTHLLLLLLFNQSHLLCCCCCCCCRLPPLDPSAAVAAEQPKPSALVLLQEPFAVAAGPICCCCRIHLLLLLLLLPLPDPSAAAAATATGACCCCCCRHRSLLLLLLPPPEPAAAAAIGACCCCYRHWSCCCCYRHRSLLLPPPPNSLSHLLCYCCFDVNWWGMGIPAGIPIPRGKRGRGAKSVPRQKSPRGSPSP